ncbi:hypothetical protein [Streptomyces sp. CAU 1734]|uniref:hypothetical protein n=1 Tax=Streptomyces sp. CAU 1734 TaxID=3140360 RepID=UPI0032610657
MSDFENIPGLEVVASDIGGTLTVFVASRAVRRGHWSGSLTWTDGVVYLEDPDEYEPHELSPADARTLAAALVAGADRADELKSAKEKTS